MGFLDKLLRVKDKPIENYDDFWQWFVSQAPLFHKIVRSKDTTAIESNVFPPLSEKLSQLKDGYFFLVGMVDESTVDMIFTADGNPKNIPFVEDLVAEAPDIPGWIFRSSKPASSGFHLNMGDISIREDSLSFYPDDDPEMPDLISIILVHEAFGGQNAEQARSAGHLFLENYLGEINFLTDVDRLKYCAPNEAEKDLIPIEALPNYLETRQALYVEKYEGVRVFTENDNYSVMDGVSRSGNPLVATVNTDLLNWDKKASHPWMLVVTIPYNGHTNGLPDGKTADQLNEIEDSLSQELTDANGYLNIGRQAADNERDIFFACTDFRAPARAAYRLQQRYKDSFALEYDIFKDKYWQTVRHFGTPE